MATVSRDSASNVTDVGPLVVREQEVDGYTIDFMSFRQDIDGAPLLKGLPDDRCSSPHWGYVFKGKVTFEFADHTEVAEVGDAFYLAPGHTPFFEAGTEYVQFSPTSDVRVVSETMQRNMEARQRQMQHA
jgi:hypothetical protein